MLYGMPPTPPAPKPPGEQALSDLRKALLEESAQNTFIYLNEWKKLLVAVSEAYTMLGEQRKQGQSPDPDALLRHEIQTQLMAFALMRLLPEAQGRQAVEAAGSSPRAAALVKQLEARVEATPEAEKALAEGLAMQPLFRLLTAMPQPFQTLGQHLAEVGPKAPKLLVQANQAMATAAQQRPPL